MTKKPVFLLLFFLVLAMPTLADTCTPSTRTSCSNGICYTIGTVTKYLNENCDTIETASSLKNYFKFEKVKDDKNYKIKIEDFNYTFITLKVSVSDEFIGKNIPLTFYNKKNESDVIIKNLQTIILTDNKEKEIVLPYIFGSSIKFGTASTELIMNDTNTGIMADTHVAQYSPTSNYGTNTATYLRENSSSIADWGLFRIKTSLIPSGLNASVDIYNATFYIFDDTIENGCSEMWIGIVNTSTNSWNETGVTWNNKPNKDIFLDETNITVDSGDDDTYIHFNITTFIRDAYERYEGNFSFFFTGQNLTSNCDLVFRTREYTGYEPYFIVWYNESAIITPVLPVSYEICISNTTLFYNRSISINGNINNTQEYELCQYGCDNVTATCKPIPFVQDLINVSIFLAFALIVFASIRFLKVRK